MVVRFIKNYFGTIIFVAAVYVFISGAVRYNLSATTALIETQPTTIVIDAGHGGEDGGAVGISGIKESTLNLSVSLKLDQFLTFCGFHTKMIRTTDDSVYTQGDSLAEKKVSDLKNRVAMIDQASPAILLSIHQNHFSEEQYSGAQVFFANTLQSKTLAELTQAALRHCLDPNNKRPCKKASSVYLLEQIQCPGILVECGFLSNSAEEQKLQQSDYQKKIVLAIGHAMVQFTAKGDSNFEV